MSRTIRPLFHWPQLFGYDFFVSFKLGPHEDGGSQSYASDLVRRLGMEGYQVYFCETEAVPGEPLWGTVMRALRRSKTLIVIANEGALLRSGFVRREVAEYRSRHPLRRVIIINVDGAIERFGKAADAGDWLVRNDPVWLDEPGRAARAGVASDATVAGVIRAARFVRARAWMRLSLAAVFSAITLLAVAATHQAWMAQERLRNSQLLTVTLLSRQSQFDEAYEVARRIDRSDPGARLATMISRQHRSFPYRFLMLPDDVGERIYSLAISSNGDTLFATVGQSLLALNALNGHVIARRPVPGEWHSVATTGDEGEIVVVDEGRTESSVQRCVLRPPAFDCEPFDLGVTTTDIRWFSGHRSGLAIQNGHAASLELGDDGLHVALVPGYAPRRLERSHDGSTIGIWGEESRLLALAAPRGDVIEVMPAPNAQALRVLGRSVSVISERDRSLLMEASGDVLGNVAFGRAIDLLGDLLFVERRFDRKMDTGSRFHVVDPTADADLLSPFVVSEPVWAYAFDAPRGLLYLGGQFGPVQVVSTKERRVRFRSTPNIEAPLVVSTGRFLARRNWVGFREVLEIDVQADIDLTVRAGSPQIGKDDEEQDLQWLEYQDFPFTGAISPDGKWLAVGGDELRLMRLPDSRGHTLEELEHLAQQALSDDASRFKMLRGEDVLERLRWVSNDLFLTDNRHGQIVLWSVNSDDPQVLELDGDSASVLSMQGPPLISTLSGNVWTVDGQGKPVLYAHIPDSVLVFPIDENGMYFVAQMRDPERTGFLARRGKRIEEVFSVPGSAILRDAAVADSTLLLLYDDGLRAYSLSEHDSAGVDEAS